MEFIPIDAEGLDQFYADYKRSTAESLARQQAGRAWELAHEAQTYMHASANPQRITQFMAADPNKSPLPFGPVTLERQAELTQQQLDFVSSLEEAYTANAGEIPLSWFMQFDVSDLRAMRADELGVDVEFLANRQMWMASHEEFQSSIEAETDRRFEAAQRQRDFMMKGNLGVDRLMDFLNPVGDNPFGRSAEETFKAYQGQGEIQREQIRDEVWLEFTGRRDQIFEEDLTEWRERRRTELELEGTESRPGGIAITAAAGRRRRGSIEEQLNQEENEMRAAIVSGGDPGDLLDTRTAFHNVIAGGLSGIGWGVDKAATGVGSALWLIDGVMPGSGPYDHFVNRHLEQQREVIAAYEQLIASPEDEAIARAAQVGAEQAWQELPQENPEAHQFYVDMADGDTLMAAGFFFADMAEAPDVREQLGQMARQIREQDEQLLADLREEDFRFSHQAMDLLSMWGRNGPGRLATGFTLLLSDSDYWDQLSSGKYREVWNQLGEESERFGHTPSAALGIDGSLAGLTADLGLGIAFDPTTYFLGPKFLGAAKGKLMGTVDDAARVARSAPVRAMVDDILNWSQSPSRGASSTYHLMSWLDDVAIGEVLDVTGFQTKTLPARNWVNHKTGRGAMEVQTSFLQRVVDDLDLGDDATKLGENIKTNGFEEALELSLSRADNTLHLTDGAKRLAAAVKSGITHVPVRLRLMDSAAAGKTVLNGFDQAEAAAIREIAEGGVLNRLPDIGGTKKAVPGGDAEALTAALSMAKLTHSRAPGSVIGQITTKAGDTLDLRRSLIEGGSVVYYALDDAGEAVASVAARAGKVIGSQGGINMGTRVGAMEQIWDLARQHGDELILQSGRSGSISEQAVRFGQKYAQRLLEEAATTLPSVGKSIDQVIEGGAGSLKKNLKNYADGAGDKFVRPDRIIPGHELLGKVDKASLNKAVEDAIMRGARPQDGARTIAHSSLRGRVRAILKSGIPEEVRSFFTPANTVTRLDLHGPGAVKQIMTQTVKIWGDNVGKADEWMQRFMEYQRKAQAEVGNQTAKLSILQPLLRELQVHLDTAPLPGSADLAAHSARTLELRRALEAKALKVHKQLDTMPTARELGELVKEMWEDFNRTQIVPRWQKEIAKRGDEIFDEATGIVKWEALRNGRLGEDLGSFGSTSDDWLSESLAKQADEVGLQNPEKLARYLNGILETPMAANTPISPLEMIAAATVSGKQWTKFTKTVTGHSIRMATHKLHKAWVIDKVLRPATAMTVSGDELLRMFHKGGRWAVDRYVRDRGLFLSARIQTLLHGGNPLARDAVRKGARYSDKVTNRLRQLDEHTLRSREWERVFYDDAGIGWSDIKPGDPIFRDAAKQWTGGMLQQSGFRAFLRGEDAFKEWFFSVDGQAMRNATVMKKTPFDSRTGIADSVDQAFLGWKTMFEDVILSVAKKDGVFDDVLQAFRDTAAQIDNLGGKAIDLPDFVFDHMGPVRGVQKHNRSKMSPLQMTDSFFDRFFLDPVQYRRGFVADMVAQVEKARIESLILSQGKRILSDTEVAQTLGLKGLAGASRTGVRGFLTDIALKRDLVPQSYVDDLVQRAAEAEMDHMLYVAEKGSRIGKVAQSTVFPFGKPHADMMAFWGREMIRRPHFRGKINERNLGIVEDIFTAGGHLNPRTPALVSRLAATDFTIDRGWMGEVEEGEQGGLIPGSERTDLSPLLFLPTGGENPFYSLVPGAGYLPMWGLDMYLGAVGDPINDPLGYQSLVNKIGDVVAGAHFGNADPLKSITQRFLGGGTFGQAAEGLLDAYALFGDSGSGYGPVSTWLGQPDREIDRGRMASALMADPAEWEELLSLSDGQAVDLYVDALALEADQKAAAGNLSENLSRFFLPANNKYSGELDDLKDVWINAAQEYTFLGSPGFNFEAATPEERTQEAADIRNKFFDLPQWQRDMLIAQTPQLSVNLISSWDWTDLAHSSGIEGTELAYRTDGSREGLARHQIYVDQGFIRPLAPQERIRRMVGLALSAKESTAKAVYETAAERVNEVIWSSQVTDEVKNYLDVLYQGNSEFWNDIGIRSGQEIWRGWGRYEERFEDYAARALGVAKERAAAGEEDTPFDGIRDAIKIPTNMKPWGSSWPGVDPESVSGRFSEVIFTTDFFDEQMTALAAANGIELTEGMNGLQLYNAVQAVVTQTDTPLKAYADPAYQTYVGERGAPSRVVDEQLRSISFDQRYSEDWRQQVNDFMELAANTQDRWRDEPVGVPSEDQRLIQDAFMSIMQGADDNVVTDWEQLWDLRYKRSYGPLGWTPPEPLSPFGDDGAVINGAYQPIVHHVIDGDSLVVSDRMGAQERHEVRLLGVRARDFGLDDEGAVIDKDRLWDRLQQALEDGDRVFLVRQPDTFGNVDIYGRELAWLWIEDSPFYFENEMLPNRDPSGVR